MSVADEENARPWAENSSEKRSGPVDRFVSWITEGWRSSLENAGGFIPAVLIGWSLELVYGLACEGWPGGIRIFCILWFASGAAFFVGTIGGFLFGIPKAHSQPQAQSGLVARPNSAPSEIAAYRDNTNLEEVSDWLTKIIIGLGLVEIRTIASAVNDAGIAVGMAIDPSQQNGGIAIATGAMIVGFATGFLYYYLWARVYLMSRLVRIRRQALEPLEGTDAGVPSD